MYLEENQSDICALFLSWYRHGVRALEELLDQVDVGHDHATATVALQAELVHGISVIKVSSCPRIFKGMTCPGAFTHRSFGGPRSAEGIAPRDRQ